MFFFSSICGLGHFSFRIQYSSQQSMNILSPLYKANLFFSPVIVLILPANFSFKMSFTLLFSYSFQQPQLSFVFFLSCLACYMNLSMIPLTSSWLHVILTDLLCSVILLLKPLQRFLTAYIFNFLAWCSSSSQSDFGSLVTSNPLSCT